MPRFTTAAALFTLALTAHAGGIYKCEIDGRTVYQQVACPVGETARVEVADTPASSLGGGLREAEVRALHLILQDKAQRRPGNEDGALSERDATLITGIYRQLEARRGASDQGEAMAAEANPRENLGRHGLELEQVKPELPGESILDRVREELALRRLGPQARAEHRAARQRLLKAQRVGGAMQGPAVVSGEAARDVGAAPGQ